MKTYTNVLVHSQVLHLVRCRNRKEESFFPCKVFAYRGFLEIKFASSNIYFLNAAGWEMGHGHCYWDHSIKVIEQLICPV